MKDNFVEYKGSESIQAKVEKPKARTTFAILSFIMIGALILFVYGQQNNETSLPGKLDEEINLIQQTPRDLQVAMGLWSVSGEILQNQEREAYIKALPTNFDCKNYLIHIQTDKPVYKPNDLIFVQAFMIDPITKIPCKGQGGIFGQIEIRDGQGKLLFTLQNQSPIDSGSFSFVLKVPKDVLGGKYQLIVRSAIQYFLPARRQILINQYSQPEYFVTTDFDKAGANYLPGSLVKAKIKVGRPDNSPLMSGSFLKINNQQTGLSLVQSLSSQGEGVVEFNIPSDFQGSLFICSLVVMDGFSAPASGSFATSLQVSVLNVNNIYVKFFSPNTKRISGLPCTIYFQAYAQDMTQPEAKIEPFEYENAQLLYSHNGQPESFTIMPDLANIKHIHNGRGKFMFIPQDNQTYQLKIGIQSQLQFNKPLIFPVVIQTTNEFRAISENKEIQFVSITLDQTVIQQNKNQTKIDLQLFTKIPESDTQLASKNNLAQYKVNLIIMNKHLNVFNFSQIINASFWQKNNNYLQCNLSISMNLSNYSAAGGVHILQLNISAIKFNKSSQQNQQFWQEELINQFEKLIFIRSSLSEIKNVSLKLKEQNYAPGDTVKMSLNFGEQLDKDEQIFTSVIVTDVSSYLQLQNHEYPPSLPSMVFLEKEVVTLGGNTLDQSPLDQFLNSKDYVDSWFTHVESDLSNTDSQKKISELDSFLSKADANIDALLAVQDWRQGIFTDHSKYLTHAQNFDQENERLKNLIVKRSFNPNQSKYYPSVRRPEQFEPMMEKAVQYESDNMTPESTQIETAKVTSKIEDIKIQDANQDFMKVQNSLSREYCHQVRFGFSKTSPRIDFTQTLAYKASSASFDSLQFDLNDQVSTFVATVTIVTSKGRYLVFNHYFKSQLMIYSSFSMPRSMLYGDILKNENIKDQSQMISLLQTTKGQVNIVGNGYGQIWQTLNSSLIQPQWRNDGIQIFMEISLKVLDKTNLVQDSLIKYTNLFFGGAPQTYSSNGIIEVNNASLKNETTRTAFWTLNLPHSVSMVPRFSAKVFNSQLDSIIDSLKRLLQNPSGCFEQTSTTTYPQVMALSLLQEMEQSALQPDQVKQISKLRVQFIGFLKDGYKRLLNFETKEKGYEWFGESPGHEALTAYGLMQFHDMKQIKAIDFIDRPAFDRNINWLLGRKSTTNLGQFLMNPKALDSFGRAGQEVTDAYIVWALSQTYSSLSSGNSSTEIPWSQEDTYNNLQDQFNYLKQVAGQQDDPYIQALLTSALSNLNHNSEALPFAQKLSQKQDQQSGAINGAKTSITNSFGSSLDIETTSLAIIAWIQTDKGLFGDQIQLGVKYLSSITQKGQSGSTQATILSLKALALFKKYFGNFNGKGEFVLRLNQAVVQRIPFDSSNVIQNMDKIDFSQAINKKVQDIYLNNIVPQNEFEGITSKPLQFSISIENYQFNSTIPRVTSPLSVQYSISANFKDNDPIIQQNPKLNHSLSFKVFKDPFFVQQSLGSQRKLSLIVINNGSQNEGMALVHLPLPACLQLSGGSGGLEQLEVLKNKGLFNHYEMSSTELIIYWTYMKVNEKKQVDLIFIKVFQTEKDQECNESVARSYYYYSDEIINYQK